MLGIECVLTRRPVHRRRVHHTEIAILAHRSLFPPTQLDDVRVVDARADLGLEPIPEAGRYEPLLDPSRRQGLDRVVVQVIVVVVRDEHRVDDSRELLDGRRCSGKPKQYVRDLP